MDVHVNACCARKINSCISTFYLKSFLNPKYWRPGTECFLCNCTKYWRPGFNRFLGVLFSFLSIVTQAIRMPIPWVFGKARLNLYAFFYVTVQTEWFINKIYEYKNYFSMTTQLCYIFTIIVVPIGSENRNNWKYKISYQSSSYNGVYDVWIENLLRLRGLKNFLHFFSNENGVTKLFKRVISFYAQHAVEVIRLHLKRWTIPLW